MPNSAKSPDKVRYRRHRERTGVVNSALGTITSCYSGHLCYYAERDGNSQTRWLITPGASCGKATVEFMAENARGKRVGYAFLELANKYCP